MTRPSVPLSLVCDGAGLAFPKQGDSRRGLGATWGRPSVRAAPDFYSRSGCRGLLFREHEDRFDLPGLDGRSTC